MRSDKENGDPGWVGGSSSSGKTEEGELWWWWPQKKREMVKRQNSILIKKDSQGYRQKMGKKKEQPGAKIEKVKKKTHRGGGKSKVHTEKGKRQQAEGGLGQGLGWTKRGCEKDEGEGE